MCIRDSILTLKVTDYLENSGSITGKTTKLNAGQMLNKGIIYGKDYLTLTAVSYTHLVNLGILVV